MGNKSLINQFGGDIIVISNYNEEKDTTKTKRSFLRVVSEKVISNYLLNLNVEIILYYFQTF